MSALGWVVAISFSTLGSAAGLWFLLRGPLRWIGRTKFTVAMFAVSIGLVTIAGLFHREPAERFVTLVFAATGIAAAAYNQLVVVRRKDGGPQP